MKRSWQPPFWLLFGAGGMLAALVGAMLVFLTGIAAPLGIAGADRMITYENVLGFVRHPLGKAFAFAVVSLFLWHAAHRIYHSLHDLGLPRGPGPWCLCYGVALAGTVLAAFRLLQAGF